MLSVLFVDADAAPGGNGLSWGSAYADLQSALDRAAIQYSGSIEQIWIAEGTYTPTRELQSGDERSVSFSLVDGVGLYGGFSGTESALAERDPVEYETVLSGEIGRPEATHDNARTVVTCEQGVEAELSGLTISAGMENSASGGGINNEGTLSLNEVILSGNYAYDKGGAIYNSGALHLVGSTITDNDATRDGGAIYNAGTLDATDVLFSYNRASSDGGAVFNAGTISFDDVEIVGSQDNGIFNEGTATLRNTTLCGNSCSYGGAVYNSGNITIIGSVISGNTASCGGGIYNAGDLTVLGSTIAGNDGGGIFVKKDHDEPFTIINSIVALNEGGQFQGPISTDSTGNLLGCDPGFVRDPWTNGPDDYGDLRLTGRSPAIDTGNDAAIPPDTTDLDDDGDTAEAIPFDRDGNARVYGASVDIGAYEFQAAADAGRETASATVTTSEDTFDFYDGLVSLREAVHYAGNSVTETRVTFDTALAGETILLDGFEIPIDHGVTIDAVGLAVGLAGGLTIDADFRSRAFTVTADQSEAVALRGLTILNGDAYDGGGIYNAGALDVFNCVLLANTAEKRGGGIYSTGTLALTNSTIVGNKGYEGGGVHTWTATLNNTVLAANKALNNYNGTNIFREAGTITGSNNLIESVYNFSYLRNGQNGNIIGSYQNPIEPGLFRRPDPGPDGWGDDPQTVDLDESLNDDYGDLRTLPGSPLFDSGDNAFLPSDEFDLDGDGDTAEPIPFDCLGNPRILNDTVDRGALEHASAAYGSTLFVDADVSTIHDGTCWENVLSDLNVALRIASALGTDDIAGNDVTEIWVAEGTYKPLEGSRSNTFELLDGITLYGGFAGTETAPAEREWSAHETVLSGDLGVIGETSDNAYSVVSCESDTEAALDGFTITGGAGSYGTGISNSGTLLVRNSNVRENISGSNGAAVRSDGGSITVVNSTVSDNVGCGVCLFQEAVVCVVDSTIASNSGSGIYASTGSLAVTNSRIAANTAKYGAGIDWRSVDSAVITNTVFAGNKATYSGGGVYCLSGSVTIQNTTIAGNSAERGGGICSLGSSNELTLLNCIVARNSGSDMMGVVTTDTGSNLIGVDPKFVRDPGTNGPEDTGDLRPTGRSLAIDAGSTDRIPPDTADLDRDGDTSEALPWDLDGNIRAWGASVDMGAFEFQGEAIPGRETPSTVVTTTDDVFDAYDDRVSLREAICYAGGDLTSSVITFAEELAGETLVLDGTSLSINRGLTVDGASAGETVTIDADGKSRVFTIAAPADQPVELTGLTMTNGRDTCGGAVFNAGAALSITRSTLTGNAVDGTYGSGGAVYAFRGATFVTDSVFRWNETNKSNGAGGAIWAFNGTLNLDRSIFEVNRATGSTGKGGAVYLEQTDAYAANLVFVGNTAGGDGGAILTRSSDFTLTNSTLLNNAANDDGGGVYASGSPYDITLNNCILVGNTARYAGPDVYCYQGSLSGSYNLIGDGSDQSYLVDGENGNRVGMPEAPIDPRFLRNPSDGGDGWGDDPDTPYIDESENDDFGDLRVDFFSPAVDAGNPMAAVDSEGTPLEWDVLGNPRVLDGNHDTAAIVDIGAVEYVPNHAPVLLPIGDKAIDEGALLSFTVAAEDSQDDPANGIRLSARRLPPGAAFDAATGVFSWMPAGTQSGTYEVIFTATDDGVPPLWTSETISITVHDAQTPLVGDLNADARVNSADLDLIRSHWGQSVTPGDLLAGDPSGDGVVGAADLDIVRANWGKTAAADAVFDALGETPAYGPAEEQAARGPDARLTPRRWEALAWETLVSNREKSDRSVPCRLVFLSDLAWLE